MTPEKPTLTASRKARGSGIATENGKLSAVLFPNTDPDARAAHLTDQYRSCLRKLEWREVADSTVQRIADLLRLNTEKEPTR